MSFVDYICLLYNKRINIPLIILLLTINKAMSSKKLYKRISPFWIINLVGWSILLSVYLFLFYPNWVTNTNILKGLIITEVTGFLTTVILRCFYKKIKFQLRSFLVLSFFIIVGSTIASNIWYVVDTIFSIPIYGVHSLIDNMTLSIYLKQLWPKFYTMFLWSSLYFVIKFWIEWRKQEEQTEKAVLLAQNAQLQMLRQQVDPHFLFNTLSSLRSLVRDDQKKADDMILKISDFLRYSLESKKNNQVPLSEELEAIGHYLDIERVRFSKDLQAHFDIDPLANDFLVPSFIIHPLIENAIKYGMNTSPLPLIINLKAIITDNVLRFEITNSGHWSNNSTARDRAGLGLDNVKKRLQLADPDNKLLIEKKDGEVLVTLVIKGKSF